VLRLESAGRDTPTARTSGPDRPALVEGAADDFAAIAAIAATAATADLADLAIDLLEPAPAGPRTPRWQGACAETGVWARHRQDPGLRLATPWLRLGARLAEIARLALAGKGSGGRPAWLACGGVSLARDGALAWVEMARGVLMHAVRLEGQGSGARIAACGVLAPTEWNFHPHGALAHALAACDPDLTAVARRELDIAVLSLDPCVAHAVEDMTAGQRHTREPGHA